MSERALTLDEFLVEIRPEIERQADEMILAQPPEDRALLMPYRERIVREYVTATRIANLEHRLAEADARLRPRLVEK